MDMPDRYQSDKARLKAAYDRLAARVAALAEGGQERGAQALEEAREKTRAGLATAGTLAATQAGQLKRRLLLDLRHLSAQTSAAAHRIRPRLDPERLRDGALSGFAAVLHAVSGRLESWSRRADEAVIYEAGQISSAGTLTCLNCGRVLHLKKTSSVPPCPDCLAARFRKTY